MNLFINKKINDPWDLTNMHCVRGVIDVVVAEQETCELSSFCPMPDVTDTRLSSREHLCRSMSYFTCFWKRTQENIVVSDLHVSGPSHNISVVHGSCSRVIRRSANFIIFSSHPHHTFAN